MASNPIQWFPGHMAKTKRLMRECLPEVDVIIELLDARIPHSSKNPEIDSLIGTKPRIIVFTKSTLANPALTQRWADKYAKSGAKTKTKTRTRESGSSRQKNMLYIVGCIALVVLIAVFGIIYITNTHGSIGAFLSGSPIMGKPRVEEGVDKYGNEAFEITLALQKGSTIHVAMGQETKTHVVTAANTVLVIPKSAFLPN